MKIFLIVIACQLSLLTQSCMSNYQYYDPTTNSCKPCAYNCLTCLDSSICITCIEEYFTDNNTNLCKLCPYGCAVCVNSTSCTSCRQGLYLNGDGTCTACGIGVKSCSIAVIESCAQGYFMLGSICAGCIDNCAHCSDFATCSQCSTGYFVQPTTLQCLPCPTNCAVCSDQNTCTSCNQNYEIQSGTCINQDCLSISAFCKKCSFGICLQCSQGKYINENGGCNQGSSLLCLEATGPYHTNCQTSNYGCPFFAQPQTDIFSGIQLDVCLPSRVATLQQQIYHKSPTACLSTTCSSQTISSFQIQNLKAFYKLTFYFSIKIYNSASQSLTVQLLQNSQKLSGTLIAVDLSEEFGENLVDSACGNACVYGVTRVTGQLLGSAMKLVPEIMVTSPQGHHLLQAVIISQICTVQHCQTCSSSVDCLVCQSPYLLQLIQCVEYCDPGFYRFDQSCVLECPTIAYPVRVSYQCINCVSPCATCISETECLSCIEGYFLEESTCLLECSTDQLFTNLTSLNCETCPNPCTRCAIQGVATNWSVSCVACRVGYVLVDGSCVYLCPQGNYPNFVNDTSMCLSCLQQCSSCFIEENICLSCETTYILNIDTNKCQNNYTCIIGYFHNTTINICEKCHYPCKSCQQNQYKCISCLKGSLYNNQCPLQCPEKYYSLYSNNGESICTACVSPCVNCLSSSFCLTCQNNTYLLEGNCYVQCPLSTYFEQLSNNTCRRCLPPCHECSSESDCITCSTGFIDTSLKKCTLACNSTSYVNDNFECTLCVSPCIECFSQTICSKCQLPYILYQQNCISESNCQTLNKFVLKQLDYSTGTPFHDYSICVSCTYPCQSCSNSQIQCTSCVSNYFLVSQLKTCMQTCPLSYYSSADFCLKCDSICLDCENTATNCIKCGTGMYLYNATCIQQCPIQHYGDDIDSQCKNCKSPCKQCYNIFLCKTCETGKVLYDKVCIDSCPLGTIENPTTNQCELCTNNCLYCSIIPSNCTACPNQYYFYQNSCLEECPIYFYGDSRSEACEACLQPCLLCLSDIKCLSCVSQYYFYIDECLLDCPDGYYQNLTNCQPCNTTICSTCNLQPNNCTSCVSPYFYDSISTNSCVLECPVGSYKDTQYLQCKECIYPCSECNSPNQCQICHTNYKLFDKYCYSSCPVGYYADQDICKQCSTNCEICQTQSICLKCTTGYYANSNSQCVWECQDGRYKSLDALTNYPVCLSCPNQCATCVQLYECLTCKDNLGYQLHLFNGLCLQQCPIMYFSLKTTTQPIQNKCTNCPQNCNKCLNQTSCEQCLSSYMYKGTCYISCPSKTYLFNEQYCRDCVAPCKQCSGQFFCETCLTGYFYYQNYCLVECPEDVWTYPENGSCLAECPYNKYLQAKECYVVGCGGMMVHLEGYCLQKCPQDYYVDQNQNCKKCEGSQICNNLFLGEFNILRSYQLKLSIYFTEAIDVDTLDVSKIVVTFLDLNDATVSMEYNYTNITYDEYSLTIEYDYKQIYLKTVHLRLPYIQSTQSLQSINKNYFSSIVYSYNDFSMQSTPKIQFLGILALIFVVLMFLAVLANIVVKSSSFFQVFDFMQFIAATLYLQIQYPPVLEHYLKNLSYILWSFVPQLANFQPYAKSPTKYVQYFVDTSLLRAQGLTFILFSAFFLISLILIIINRIKPQYCNAAVKRIRYRHLTDLFSIFMLPLLIFSFHLINSYAVDLVVSVFFILISIGYLILITYKLITAKSYSQIPGLTGDLQNIEATLGKMYTPFAFIRKIIFAFVLCIQPDKPISTLTILLVFTTLIMVCLIFYQPFEHIITDYVCIFMEVCLVIYVFLLILFGLNAVIEESAHNLGIVCVVLTVLGIFGGQGWLVYLTILAGKKFRQSLYVETKEPSVAAEQKNKEEDSNHHNVDTQNNIGITKKEINPQIIRVRNRVSMQSAMNSEMYEDEASANNLISKKNNDFVSEESVHGQNHQFRHWNASQSSDHEQEKNKDFANEPPMYLKKIQRQT